MQLQVQNLQNMLQNQQTILVAIQNEMRFIRNGSVTQASHAIVMPANAAGLLPNVWAPATNAELTGMSGPQATALLQFYNVPVIPHGLQQRRAAVANALGVRMT